MLRQGAILAGVLGGIGLLLAAAGLYAIVSFQASRRTRKIGGRVALVRSGPASSA